jgi:hypothetical protein
VERHARTVSDEGRARIGGGAFCYLKLGTNAKRSFLLRCKLIRKIN